MPLLYHQALQRVHALARDGHPYYKSLTSMGRHHSANALVAASELEDMFRDLHRRQTEAEFADLARRARGTPRSTAAFDRTLREIATVAKSLPKPEPVAAGPTEPSPAEIVTKALHALHTDPRLTPEQRGRTMLAISGIREAVFAKAQHPGAVKIDAAIKLLREARGRKLGAGADALIAALLAAIERGEVEPGDTLRLEEKLREIRAELMKEHPTNGKE